MSPRRGPKFAMDELRPFLDPAQPWAGLANRLGATGGARINIRTSAYRGEVGPRLADRFAVAIGKHPAEIWGMAWWDE